MKATAVTKAKKDQGQCSKCGDALPAGSAYVWTQARFGPRIVRCTKFECRLRASDLTSSDKLARLYEIQEEIEDFVVDAETTLEDVRDLVTDWADRAAEVAEEYGESAQSVEDGFGHETSTSEDIREKEQAAEDWADSLRDCDLPEEWDADEARREVLAEIEEGWEASDVDNAIHEKRQEWEESIESVLGDVSGELSI